MLFNRKEEIDTTTRWSALMVFIGVLVFNGLAGSSTVLGGTDTAGVSNAYPTLFTPAGTTFAIWGVIYALLGVFCLYLYGAGRLKRTTVKPEQLNTVMQWFTLSSVLNVLWIITWQYKVLWASVICIVGLLACLAKIATVMRESRPKGWEYIATKLPFSVYFGWVTVATIANISVWLVSMNWDGFGIRPGVWTVGMLLVGALLGIFAALRNSDWAYLAVFIWAYAGILLNHLAPNGYNGSYPTIIVTTSILLAIFSSLFLHKTADTLLSRIDAKSRR